MTIKLKRGLKSGLPLLQQGEPAFTTDTKELFIGDGTDNIRLSSTIIETTYAALKALRGAGVLTPGQQYRITDYTCTTVQDETQSAEHAFDLIVVADSVDKLNEQARAIQHAGDTYFANSKLEAWKIWYCLDNDTSRFAWADTVNGKGVIYRMIDEGNNDIPYDFKNIKFLRDGLYYYTFTAFENTNETIKDASTMREMIADDMVGQMTNNSMKTLYEFPNGFLSPQILNFNIFKGYYDEGGMMHMPANNHFGCNCRDNFFDGMVFVQDNTFGNNCSSNTFGNLCFSNTFGNQCDSNTFGNNCTFNTFGNSCYGNTFGTDCSSNTLGYQCFQNTFGTDCSSNTFSNGFQKNTFGNSCYGNTFGDDCRNNKITGDSVKYLNVDNGIKGASSANKLELYDSAIVNKTYQISFKKAASGKYLMLWATDTGTMTGKVKDSNTDTTWKDII